LLRKRDKTEFSFKEKVSPALAFKPLIFREHLSTHEIVGLREVISI